MKKRKLGIIGGSGLYKIEGLSECIIHMFKYTISKTTDRQKSLYDLDQSIQFSWLKLLSLYFIVIYFFKRIIIEKSTN